MLTQEDFRASTFDERGAMLVLIDVLPTLTDERVVASVARHLRRPWCRPAAFPALHSAYRRWALASPDGDPAWALGDALATAASIDDLPVLLEIVQDNRYGDARRMVIDALWRFRKDARVGPALNSLVEDPAVSLHAMSGGRWATRRHCLAYVRSATSTLTRLSASRRPGPFGETSGRHPALKGGHLCQHRRGGRNRQRSSTTDFQAVPGGAALRWGGQADSAGGHS